MFCSFFLILASLCIRAVEQDRTQILSNHTHPEQSNSFVPTFFTSYASICGTKRQFLKTPCSTSFLPLLLIALAGDTHLNPGPRRSTPKFPCGSCSNEVKSIDHAMCCDSCDQWFHTKCIGMSSHTYDILCHIPANEAHNYSFQCPTCGLPSLSSSFFTDFSFSISDSDSLSDTSTSPTSPVPDPGSPLFYSSPKQPTSARKVTPLPKSLRTLTINFQSITGKIPSLLHLLDSAKPDIIFGTETWLSPDIHSSEIFPQNYSVYRHDRNDGYGGSLIAVSSTLSSSRIPVSTDCDFVAVKIEAVKKNQPIICIAGYRPTNDNQVYLANLCTCISDVVRSFPSAIFWVSGDFNLPDIDWESESITSNQYPKLLNENFLSCLSDNGLEQMVDFPTRYSNTLDIFATNRPSFVQKCKPMPGLSDHSIIFTENYVSASRTKPVKRKIYLWKKANLTSLKKDLDSYVSNFTSRFTSSTPVQSLWDDFSTECNRLIEQYVPSKLTSSRFHQPWVNTEIKRLSRRKQKAYNRAKRTQHHRHWAYFNLLKKQAHAACKRAYNQYISNLLDDSSPPKKSFWSFIKSRKCDNAGVSPLKRNGIIYTANKAKAQTLNDQFSSVFTHEIPGPLPSKGNSPFSSMEGIVIDNNGVLKQLSSLNPNKATGPDGLSPNFLKTTASSISPALTLIFQASLHQGKLPIQWKDANVVPIFKKGDRSQPSNYRPVSLTSVCCKVLEHIIFSRTMHHLNRFNILSELQHGFRSKHSCESQLILTVHDLAEGLRDKEQMDCILLDFSKAFDKVPHRRLLYKLSYYGIRGTSLAWITDFLSNRTQRVVLDGSSSDTSLVSSGVPQGTVLGPLLFLCFINDLPETVSSSARLFADDCLLYRKIRSIHDSQMLQQDLDSLQRWENTWLMSFNPDKCETLRVSLRKRTIAFTYTIHNKPLELVDTAKYLGVTIQSKLSWKPHISNITKKANSTLGFLRRNLRTCPITLRKLSYTCFVRPTLEYASTVWSPHWADEIQQIEAVQRRAARFIVRDYSYCSSPTQMLHQLNLPTLEQRRHIARATMMYKVVNQLVAIPSEPYLLPKPRGNPLHFIPPHSRVNAHLYSFFPQAVRIWNNLGETVNSPSLEAFKMEAEKSILLNLNQDM